MQEPSIHRQYVPGFQKVWNHFICQQCPGRILFFGLFCSVQDEPSTVAPIIGDYSKKIQEIVRTTLKLLKSDPDVKILIFSYWNDMLKIIAAALNQNGIQSRTKSTNFDNCIDEFKVSLNKTFSVSMQLKKTDTTHFLIERKPTGHLFVITVGVWFQGTKSYRSHAHISG